MANARLTIVCIAVLFGLYWGGAVQAIARSLLSFLLAISPFRVQYVADANGNNQAEKLKVEEEMMNTLADAMDMNQKKITDHLLDVVNMMEGLIENNDMGSMDDNELEETFGQLYDMFPLMDEVFAKALEYESGVSINPRNDYHETYRRYEALRKVLGKRRKAKEEQGKIKEKKKTVRKEEKEEDDDMEAKIEDEL